MMIAVIFPIFALMAAGFASVRFGLLAHRDMAGLTQCIFKICIPYVLFAGIQTTDIAALWNLGFFVSFYAGSLLVFALATLHYRAQPFAPIMGISAAFSNQVFVGIPLVALILPSAPEGLLVFANIAVQGPVLLTLTAVLMAARGKQSPRAFLVNVGLNTVKNPVVMSLAVGLLYKLTLPAPTAVLNFLAPVGKATGLMALFAMGGLLHQYGLPRDWRPYAPLSALKLVLMPLAVFLMVQHLFALPPAIVWVATLLSALPVGTNAFLSANYYGQGEREAMGNFVVCTLLSASSLSVWLVWLSYAVPL